MSTEANNSNSVTFAIPIGLTITREAVPSLAARLAEDLFYCTKGDIYKYLPDSSAKESFANTITSHLHVILNQMNVDKNYCEHCDKPQQDHDYVGGYCTGGNGQKFTGRGGEQKK